MHNLALAYLRTKRPEQAKYIIQRAVDLEENNPGSYVLLGQVYEQLDLPPKALEAWEKAHALSPRSPSILNALAVQYLRVGDHQSASDLLQGAVRYSPSYVEARINLGNALRGLKEYAGAKSAYEQSLKLNPLAADAHYNLGILFLQNDVDGQGELERFKRALREFEQFRERAGLGAAEDLEALIQETQGLIKLAVERREQALKAEEESEDDEDEESDEEDEPLE
jgi:Tfp pilus assembly protein PilF